MPNTRYRRGKVYAADMAVYTRQMAADNSQEVSRLKRNLIRALKEDVTAKQRQVLLLYYAEGLNMREIGEQLGGGQIHYFPDHQAGRAAAPTLPALWGGGLFEKHGPGVRAALLWLRGRLCYNCDLLSGAACL